MAEPCDIFKLCQQCELESIDSSDSSCWLCGGRGLVPCEESDPAPKLYIAYTDPDNKPIDGPTLGHDPFVRAYLIHLLG
jgi:hypothetical protein